MSAQGREVRVCFVCSGNICRSPTAEVVLIKMLADAGMTDVVVDSAGTGGWHAGDDMDTRSRATLHAHGYDHPRHRARQFHVTDFSSRDLVLALDSGHLRWLQAEARRSSDPSAAFAKIAMLRSFDSSAVSDLDVGDPYYGGSSGFVTVLRQIEAACAGLLPRIAELRLAAPG